MDEESSRARLARISDLFNAAIQWPVAERAHRLDLACGEDRVLRGDVQSLIDAHEKAGRFLADPTVPQIPCGPHPAETVIPGGIGRYLLRRVIGEGGFGTVWLAEQEMPIRRSVAIKVIKVGMDTRQVIARFELERQALAMMEHSNIARIFDAGANDEGRPYFVMEWVDGKPITEYCRSAGLPLKERLRLFMAVASAVQHAHQKGIIHRDLKPSNVLVTLAGGAAVPKVIDFGIAKALAPGAGAGLGNFTTTGHQQFLGTPQYMSPEQASGVSTDIDTRADIYSLGALLYELLTDVPPFEQEKLRLASHAELQRLIGETTPPIPSLRLRTGQDRSSDAANRGEANRRAEQLRGDLDWIVMRAMEKERERRYPTAEALAEDIHRYLTGSPVSAGPALRMYRLRKFTRRNRPMITALALVAVTLVGGVAATGAALLQARHERDRAEAARRNEATARAIAEEQRAAAETQRAAAQKSADDARRQADKLMISSLFLHRILAPNATPQANPPPLNLLDYVDAVSRDGFLNGHPETEEPLRAALGASYMRYANWDRAERQFNAALASRRQMSPGTDYDEAAYLNDLGICMAFQGRYAEAEVMYRQSLSCYVARTHNEAIATVEPNLAAVLAARGEFDQAVKYLRDARERRRQLPDVRWRPVLQGMDDLIRSRSDARDPNLHVLREARNTLAEMLGKD